MLEAWVELGPLKVVLGFLVAGAASAFAIVGRGRWQRRQDGRVGEVLPEGS